MPEWNGCRLAVALFVTAVASSVSSAEREPTSAHACPLWNSGKCSCGSDIGGIVHCDNETGKVSLLFGYCMTLINDTNTDEGVIVGRCPLSVDLSADAPMYFDITSVNSMCSPYSKDGELCGKCAVDTGISFTLMDYGRCYNCSQSPNWVWAAFAALQFLPPTAIFLFILFARIRASSPHLNSLVFFCQMMAYPKPSNTISNAVNIDHTYINVLFLLYNLWSMMLVLPEECTGFCLDHTITFMHSSLINYGLCLFVFTLVIVTYSCIFCYDRAYKPVLCFFRPLRKCIDCIYSPWNTEGTLIDVLVTIVVLMYWRVTMITVGILQFTEVHHANGTLLWVGHYFDASRKLFNFDDALEVTTSLIALIVLGLLLFHPIVLACYQFRSVHIFMNKCSCRRVRLLQLYTKTLADTLQKSFKDGTNGTRDYRFFASFYFLVRLIGAYVYFTEPMWSSVFLAALFLFLLFLICCLQPHKGAMHNILDGFVFGIFALVHILHTAVQLEWSISEDLNTTSQETGFILVTFKIIIAVILTIPLAYFVICILYWGVLRCRFVQRRYESIYGCWRNEQELDTDSVQVDRYRTLYPSNTTIDSVGVTARPRGLLAQPPSRYGTVTL